MPWTRIAELTSELRRRRVFRVALLYAAVAWGVAEVSTTLFPPLGIPDWSISLVAMLLLLGFPVALVLAWAFDITPEGVRRTPATPTGVRAASGTRATDPPPGPPAVLALPLVDHSYGADHQYLGDGITEELISALARLPGLRVVSRTSAFSLRGQGLDVRALGERLGLSHVIEGSIRVAEGRLRLMVQLVAVPDGYAVWSRSFNRAVEDVFCLQAEIARAVLEALRPRLLVEPDPGAALARASTTDFEAYSRYLRGRQLWYERTPAALREGLRHFASAAALDPEYAHAHAGVADCWAILVDHGIVAPAEGLPQARAAAATALELGPDIAEAHASAGLVAQLEGRQDAAEAAFRAALTRDPACLAARHRLALLLTWQSRFAEATAELDVARETDPLSPLVATSRAWIEYFAGRPGEAAGLAAQVLEEQPDFAPARIPLALALSAAGRHGEAAAAARAAAASLAGAPVLGVLAFVLGRGGDHAGADQVRARIETLAEAHYVPRHVLAQAWSGLGRERETRALLEAAQRAGEPQLAYLDRDPVFAWLRDPTPRGEFSATTAG